MSANLLTDLKLETIDDRALTIAGIAQTRTRRVEGRKSVALVDYQTSSGRANLVQAISMRLLTAQGELAALGHPLYGSRLHELVGGPNTDTTRNLAKLFTLQALQQEPRIGKVTEVTVSTRPQQPQLLFIDITVVPIEDDTAVVIGPLAIEL